LAFGDTVTTYVALLIGLWIGIIAMLIAAVVVLLALFGAGAAACIACRRFTAMKRMFGKTKNPPEVQGSDE
jgi:hypothetical protein